MLSLLNILYKKHTENEENDESKIKPRDQILRNKKNIALCNKSNHTITNIT